MNGLDTIMTRRSVRSFTDELVSDEQIETLLRAGMAAPSAGNQQPWRFVVVHDRDLLDELSTTSPYASALTDAPVAVVVCADQRIEKHVGFWVQDCSAATQNILLAAHELGLGACWLGYYPVRERTAGLRRVLGLPEEVVPLCVIAVGHPGEAPKRVDRFEASHVRRDRW
jgi:nitroreductase